MMPPSAWSLLTPRVEEAPAPRHTRERLPAARRRAASADAPVTIRRARPGDAAVLADLAALDSARPLQGDVLIAETEHGPIAALELGDGRATADPFSPGDAAVALLRLRARQLQGAVPARRRRALAHPLRALGAGR